MIVTLTANPSVDRTAELDALVRGAVLRPLAVRLDAGGKGVNVTRALARHGVDSVAVLPVGGPEGRQLLELLRREGLDLRVIPVAGSIRANVTLAEADGTTTKINEPGPVLSADEVDRLERTLLGAAAGAEWVVLAGSVPPGAPTDLYARLTRRLHEAGARVAIDADGPLFDAALAAGPDLIKPNRRELEEAAGVPVGGPRDVPAAVARLRALGATAVLASLGAGGAVLADASGIHHATAPAVTPRSTVGAGDALLAGFLAAGASGPDALATGVAFGTAAVALAGSQMPAPEDVDRDAVRVKSMNLQEVLP
jgi:1-phosphofructokinase